MRRSGVLRLVSGRSQVRILAGTTATLAGAACSSVARAPNDRPAVLSSGGTKTSQRRQVRRQRVLHLWEMTPFSVVAWSSGGAQAGPWLGECRCTGQLPVRIRKPVRPQLNRRGSQEDIGASLVCGTSKSGFDSHGSLQPHPLFDRGGVSGWPQVRSGVALGSRTWGKRSASKAEGLRCSPGNP